MNSIKKGDFFRLNKDLKKFGYEKDSLWICVKGGQAKISFALYDENTHLMSEKCLTGSPQAFIKDFEKTEYKVPQNAAMSGNIANKKGTILEAIKDFSFKLGKETINVKEATKAVVIKGGNNPHVRIAYQNNEDFDKDDIIISAGTGFLNNFKESEPAEEESLKKWKVKSSKSFDTSDGYAFEMVLTYDGKKAATVTNGGYGGPDDIYFENKDYEKKYNDILKETEKKIGEKVDIDTLSAYFFENEKGLRTFEKSVDLSNKSFKKMMEEAKPKRSTPKP